MRVSVVILTACLLMPGADHPRAGVRGSQSPSPQESLDKLVGAWRIDRSSSTVQAPPEGQRPPQGRGGSGGGGGRPPGGGGGGGRGGGMGGFGIPGMGGMGGPRQPSEDDIRRQEILRRRLSDAPERLTISRRELDLTFDDSNGLHYAITVDGKRQDRVTGDGEFKTRARIEKGVLIVEDDYGDGAKAITTYTTMLYGDERLLDIEVKVEGLSAGPSQMSGGQGGQRGQPRTSSKRTYEADRGK